MGWPLDTGSRWTINLVKCGYVYSIQNVDSKEYLYAEAYNSGLDQYGVTSFVFFFFGATTKYYQTARPVFVTKNNAPSSLTNAYLWQIYQTTDNSGAYNIVNHLYFENLYTSATTFDQERGYIFSFTPTSQKFALKNSGATAKWTIAQAPSAAYDPSSNLYQIILYDILIDY